MCDGPLSWPCQIRRRLSLGSLAGIRLLSVSVGYHQPSDLSTCRGGVLSVEYPAPNTGGEQGGQLRPDNSLLEENPQAEQRQQGLPAVLSVEYPSVQHKDIKPGIVHRHIENPQAEQRQPGLPVVLSVEYPSVRHKDIKPGVVHRQIENPQAEQRQEGLPAVLSVEYPSVQHKDIKPGIVHRHIENPLAEQRQPGLPAVLSVEYPHDYTMM